VRLQHKIIALQNGGTGAPTLSELVSLPGAYSDADPGIYDPDVYKPAARLFS